MNTGVVACEVRILEPDQHLRVFWRTNGQYELKMARMNFICEFLVLYIAIQNCQRKALGEMVLGSCF